MGGLAPALPSAGVQSLPCQSIRWPAASLLMPSHQTSPSSVSATLVKMMFSLSDGHGVEVGLFGGARGDAEEAGFRVDRVEAGRPVRGLIQAMSSPMVVIFQPFEALRRNQHGEVGLAAGGREGGGDVVLLALGRFDAEDQHVLGQPALVARHVRGDAQREALLAEQRIAAVAGTVGPDFAGFREMARCTWVGLHGQRDILLRPVPAARRRCARRARTRRRSPSSVEDLRAHARHDAHVDHDVGRIGESRRRSGRSAMPIGPMRNGHDVHRAPVHAAREQAAQRLAHLGRIFPVVGGAGVFLLGGADVGAIFDARDVGRIGAGEEGVRALRLVQLDQGAGVDHFVAQTIVFFLRAVAPDDAVRLGQGGDFGDPLLQASVTDIGRRGRSGQIGNALIHDASFSR